MSAWIPGAVILGEYTIEKELGRGGMGRVWLVKSNSTGRRFAVKQALIRDEKHSKAFLAELQTWIDLPEHQNIVPCRFFRTVGDEIVIFADFIEGGSLADWITKRKLTTLERILDVAIQFAWGLHAIHERGLVHQDVKPNNVLMTSDGIPMVADFGLARARMQAPGGAFVSPDLTPGQQSVLVSVGGMTPAYASPEQRSGKPLSRKTDIWSWGVSVLDMFMGGVSCPHGGHIAGEVLAYLVESDPPDSALPQLPEELASILRQCFTVDAGKRWVGIEVVALHLESLYERVTRKLPRFRFSSVRIGNISPNDRLSTLGISWANPREWLKRALHLAGRSIGEADDFSSHLSMSKRGQAAADIACYDYALSVLEGACKDGTTRLDQAIAEICIQKAVVHEYSSDLHGAMLLVARAINSYEQLIPRRSGPFLVMALACAWNFAAILAHKGGDDKKSLDSYNRAIACIEQDFGRTADRDVDRLLANLLMNRAMVLADGGQRPRALRDYGDAIKMCRFMISEKPDAQSVEILSAAHLNCAAVLQDLAEYEEAEHYIDEAINIRENMASGSGDDGRLANAYMAKGRLLVARGKDEEGYLLYEKGVAIRLACIEQGRTELLPLLAEDYLNQCAALSRRGQRKAAQELADKAVSILEDVVSKNGRTEFLSNLANASVNAACSRANLRDFLRASAHLDRAIQIYGGLVQRGDRKVSDQLDNALTMRQQIKRDLSRQEADRSAQQAMALSNAGRIGEALLQYRNALSLDSNDPDIWVNYGAACSRADDHKAALEAFEKALKLDPNNATAWHNIGAILGPRGRLHDALDAFRRAVELGHMKSKVGVQRCVELLERNAAHPAIRNGEERKG